MYQAGRRHRGARDEVSELQLVRLIGQQLRDLVCYDILRSQIPDRVKNEKLGTDAPRQLRRPDQGHPAELGAVGGSNSGSASIGSNSGDTQTGTTAGTGVSNSVSNSSGASADTNTGTTRGTGKSRSVSNSS